MTQKLAMEADIAARGTDIYRRKYLNDFEARWRGRFVAIDIQSEQAFVADLPEEALEKARSELPGGVFYLIRIGSPGAFKTSRLNADVSSRLV